ncbi:MAG: hypothetical protein AAGB93_10960 [Planctomycetota bacterium]
MKSLALAAPLFLAPTAALAEADSRSDAFSADASPTEARPVHAPAAGVDTGGFSVAATAALNQLDDLVALGRPVTGGICTLEETIGTLPVESVMRARMTRLIEDFRDRAARAFLGFQDVAVLRNEYVQARIDAAMDELHERAVLERWTREKYVVALEEWIDLSSVFADAPDPSAYRERFRQAIKPAIQNAKSIARLQRSMQACILEERLYWAIKVAQARRSATVFLPEDEVRILDLIQKWRSLLGEPEETDPYV